MFVGDGIWMSLILFFRCFFWRIKLRVTWWRWPVSAMLFMSRLINYYCNWREGGGGWTNVEGLGEFIIMLPLRRLLLIGGDWNKLESFKLLLTESMPIVLDLQARPWFLLITRSNRSKCCCNRTWTRSFWTLTSYFCRISLLRLTNLLHLLGFVTGDS